MYVVAFEIGLYYSTSVNQIFTSDPFLILMTAKSEYHASNSVPRDMELREMRALMRLLASANHLAGCRYIRVEWQ